MAHESENVLVWLGQGLVLLARHFDQFNRRQEEIQMDTKKLLDAVERQKSESASLRELAKANNAALKQASDRVSDMAEQIADLKTKLDQATSAPDADKDKQIAELKQQVADLQTAADATQAEIDNAADELDADNQDVQEVLSANVQPSAGNQQSGGASQEPSSSSSSSTASGGGGDQSSGGVKKPDPLPGTGVSQQASESSSSQEGASGQQSGQSSQIAPTETPALSGGIADPSVPGSMPPPEDTDAAGQSSRSLGSDPNASQPMKSGA